MKRMGRNPDVSRCVGIGDVRRTVAQGRLCLATQGFGAESRWDSRTWQQAWRPRAEREQFDLDPLDAVALALRAMLRHKCPSCGTDYPFHYAESGEERACPQCEATVVLTPPIWMDVVSSLGNGTTMVIGLLVSLAEIVVGAWLLVRGEWLALGLGIAVMWLWPFVVAVLLAPAMAAGGIGLLVFKVVGRRLSIPFGILAYLAWPATLVAWGTAVIWFYPILGSPASKSLLLIWSFGVAVWPWIRVFTTSHSPETPNVEGRPASHILAFIVGCLGCVVARCIWNVTITTCAVISSVAMSPVVLQQMATNVQGIISKFEEQGDESTS